MGSPWVNQIRLARMGYARGFTMAGLSRTIQLMRVPYGFTMG